MPMSSNSPYYWPEFIYAVDAHDFYTNEMEYHPPEREIFPTHPIYTFKLVDALKRLVAITGIPRAFEPYRLNDKPGHIRLWIAQAYAFGHVFMVPVKMWTIRNKNEPDYWYYSKPGDYEPIYHFIRDYPELFEGYESVASVALIFSNKMTREHLSGLPKRSHRGGQERRAPDTDLCRVSIALALENIPHRYIVAGDEWVEDDLLDTDLSNYQAVVRFEPSYLTERQETKLQEVGDRLVTYSNSDALLGQLEQQILVEGADNLSCIPRYQPDDSGAPVNLHLLNSNYDAETDSYIVQRDFTVTLSESLYGRSFSSATLYAPEQEPITLQVETRADTTRITVPRLDMWGILKLS